VTTRQQVEKLTREIYRLQSSYSEGAPKTPEQAETDKRHAVALTAERDALRADIQAKKKAKRDKLMKHAHDVLGLMYRAENGEAIKLTAEERFSLHVAWSIFFDSRDAVIERSIRYCKRSKEHVPMDTVVGIRQG
jgi:hypothetical protein